MKHPSNRWVPPTEASRWLCVWSGICVVGAWAFMSKAAAPEKDWLNRRCKVTVRGDWRSGSEIPVCGLLPSFLGGNAIKTAGKSGFACINAQSAVVCELLVARRICLRFVSDVEAAHDPFHCLEASLCTLVAAALRVLVRLLPRDSGPVVCVECFRGTFR